MGDLVNLTDTKTYLQITYSNDDALLANLIHYASSAIEGYCQRSFSTINQVIDILDGGVNVLILNIRPISSIVNVIDLASAATDEVIGTGDGSKTSFAWTARQTPIVPGTLIVEAAGITGQDNGLGQIIGTGIAAGSTVNYATGVIVVNFSLPPGPQVPVSIDYAPQAAVVPPGLYSQDLLRGIVWGVQPALSNFGIPAGMFDFFDSEPVWGDGKRRWQVTYQAGYAAVPNDVQLAALQFIASLYNRRDRLSEEQIGDYRYVSTTGDRAGLPTEIEALLTRYVDVIF